MPKGVTFDAPEDDVLDRVAAAEPLESIAKSYGIHRATLHRWLTSSDERKRGYAQAQQASATAHAELSVQILDDAAEDRDISGPQATIAKARADSHKWLAERFDRDTFGADPTVQMNVLSTGELHLDALRQFGSMERNAPKALSATPAESEGD